MKKRTSTLKDLIEQNKNELLKNANEVEKIEKRLEEKLAKKIKVN